jgi:opacity protein-like surface antigen
MKTTHPLLIASCLILLALGPVGGVSAQPSSPGDFVGGLLGQHHSGVELEYVRHRESAPRVLRRYGFVASRPMPDGKDLDGLFRYNYTRGSSLGPDGQQHDLAVGLAGYRANGPVTPFLEGQIGWAWARGGAERENAFFYQLRAGVEVMLSSHVSLAPFVSYQEARRFRDHDWQVGAKAAFRLNPRWSTTLALSLDDAHSVGTAFGIQRRF